MALSTHRSAALILAAALAALAPGSASAASSGGWSNLGHGATSTAPALNDKVETFTNVGSLLYVGGDFTNAGGVAAADHIATWNGKKWAAVGGGLGDGASAVYAIAVDRTTGDIYAGGSFQNAGGDTAADGIAVYDGTWHSLAHTSVVGTVFALAIVGRTLYVGGSFANLGGPAGDGISAWGLDSHAWAPIGGDQDIGGTVATVIPDGSGGIFIGGSFQNVHAIPAADFVVRWNGSYSALGSSAALGDRVFGLAFAAGYLYVVGDFINAGGVAAADKVAVFDGSNWGALGTTSEFGESSAVRVSAVVVDSSHVFVAGNFKNAGGDAKIDGIAGYSDGFWLHVGTDANGTNGPVSIGGALFTLRLVGGKLYAGGLETHIGGAPTLNASAASYQVYQPDALIATTGANVGNNVYNTTGAGQTKSLTVHRGNTGTFKVLVTNDGWDLESLPIKGPGSAGGFSVSYFLGATNITASVVAGTFTPVLTPTQNMLITVKVKVGSGVSVGTAHSLLITERSQTSGVKDVVKATVKAS